MLTLTAVPPHSPLRPVRCMTKQRSRSPVGPGLIEGQSKIQAVGIGNLPQTPHDPPFTYSQQIGLGTLMCVPYARNNSRGRGKEPQSQPLHGRTTQFQCQGSPTWFGAQAGSSPKVVSDIALYFRSRTTSYNFRAIKFVGR